MKQIAFVASLLLCLLLCSVSFSTAESLVPASKLPVEPVFEPSKEYAEYTVVEYRIPGIDAVVNCTVNRKGDGSEYFVQCDLYGDNSESRSVFQDDKYVITESSSGLMEFITPDVLHKAIDQNIWLKIGGTHDISILPFYPAFMPLDDYDEFTTIAYTVDGIDQELLCTVSRKIDGAEYYLECNLLGDNLMSRANCSSEGFSILESNSGILGIITSRILEKAIEQDIWLPITEEMLAAADNAIHHPAPITSPTEAPSVAPDDVLSNYPEDMNIQSWGYTAISKANVRSGPSGAQIAQIAEPGTYIWVLGSAVKKDIMWYRILWNDLSLREGYIRSDLVVLLSQEENDLYQSTLPSPVPVITISPMPGATASPVPVVTPSPTSVKPTEVPANYPTTEPTSSLSSGKTATGSSFAKATSTANTRTSFTNKYGTRTTICAHPGCNNYIASSGDTNCCVLHSRNCLECGKYIDEDATYCMDCIKKAAGQAAKDSGRTCDDSGCSKVASKTLIVTQPNGQSAAFYLCPSHYSEYKSLFNSKQGWKAE